MTPLTDAQLAAADRLLAQWQPPREDEAAGEKVAEEKPRRVRGWARWLWWGWVIGAAGWMIYRQVGA